MLYCGEVIVDELGRLRGPTVCRCQQLHRSIRSTEDAKIFLVVRRGWQVRINRRSVIEVREREAHGDISSEETTSQHLL